MFFHGGLSFEGQNGAIVVRVGDCLAENATVLRTVVFDEETCKALVAELIGSTPDIEIVENHDKKVEGEVDLTSMNSQDAIKLIEVATVEELDLLEETEKANSRYYLGRKAVLEAIQIRRDILIG